MSAQQGISKIAMQRRQQVLYAIDRIANRDQLAFLTTQRVSKESSISDGVLFRHFASKDAMLQTWIEQRGEQLRLLLESMPAGRNGLMYVLQQILTQDAILGFLCCQPMDTPHLRQQLETCRSLFYRVMQTRIELLPSTPIGISPEALTDHLIQSIYRAWNPDRLIHNDMIHNNTIHSDTNHNSSSHDDTNRNTQKELLMNKLPWEKTDSKHELFPEQEILQRLALNDSGFVFDPLNGRSFSANPVGLYILRFLQQNHDIEALMATIDHDFDVSPSDVQRDITEFSAQLRKFLV